MPGVAAAGGGDGLERRGRCDCCLATSLGGWSVAGLAAGALLPAWLMAPAAAQQAGTDQLVRERFAFDAADSDGNGVVSEAELARDAARGFAALDKDGSQTLTPGELGPHDPALFTRVDANGDGVLTFSEVMQNKVRALKAGDDNEDGGL